MTGPNTSATGGFLLPSSALPPPLEDQALDIFFQQLVAGVAGLPGNLVRPRFQSEPPNIPDYTTPCWAAVGVIEEEPDDNAYIAHTNTGDGFDTLQRHEQLTILISFYGALARSTAKIFRDGMAVPQNREVFAAQKMGLVNVGTSLVVSGLIAERWLYQVDVRMLVRRQVIRQYGVLNVESANIEVIADTGQGTEIREIPVPPPTR